MSNIKKRHTRGILRCWCGIRHSRDHYLYLRDQHQAAAPISDAYRRRNADAVRRGTA